MSTIVQYEFDFNPIYTFLKKHYCPECNCKMSISYTCKVVSLNDMKPGERPFGELPNSGDVEIRTPYLICPVCNRKISFKEMKVYEKTDDQLICRRSAHLC